MSARPEIAKAQRVVVKVGSSSLTTLPGGLDEGRLAALVAVLAGLRAAGREVVLVSSGAIAAGLAPLGLTGRPRDLATAQAAASVGQLRLGGSPAPPLPPPPPPPAPPATASPSGRCCSPPTTSPGAATTATPSALSTGCWPSARSRSST